jgi:hypothetical protein
MSASKLSVTAQSRPHRYRLYIDESGDHALKAVEAPEQRYLALLGVWFRQNPDYVAYADALEEFKRKVFGPRPDKPVVLHRTAIMNRKGAFGVLCDDALRLKFDEGLLSVVKDAQFHMVCVIIDKKRHVERYTSPFHPYHYCLAAMLDRYSGWLNYKNSVGDVIAEARGKEEDLQLSEAYRRVYEGGTLMFNHAHHQRALTSKDIKIRRKSDNIAGLQLADLLAQPVRQAMLCEKGVIKKGKTPFADELLKVVEPKFNRQEWTGQVDGYGKVWLPK